MKSLFIVYYRMASGYNHNHEHYLYKIHFNKILKMVMPNVRCSLEENKKRIEGNEKRRTKVNGKKYYLLYSEKSHCTYVEIAAHTLRASDATASRNFHVVPATLEDIDLQALRNQDIIIPEDHIIGTHKSFIDIDTVVTHAQALMEPGDIF